MSTENIVKYQNDTGFIADRSKEAGIGLFQTVLLSLTIISSIVLVFSLVYYMLRKRSLDELRHRLVPLYHFDPGECEDWEDELLEDSKREIIRSNHKGENNPIVHLVAINWVLYCVPMWEFILVNVTQGSATLSSGVPRHSMKRLYHGLPSLL